MEFPLGVKFRYESVPLLWEIKEVYSKAGCQRFIRKIESSNPAIATRNPMFRNQDRVIFDDKKIADDLFERIKDSLPQQIDDFSVSRLNERLRCYRYNIGQKFEPHMDHWYQANDREISLFSVLVYFNSDFEGGETRFMEQLNAVIKPEIGKVAVFQHKLRHEGCEVLQGIKYAMRTDVMYVKNQLVKS
ncbi:Prolyl 4-hydroxylase alpha subunit [[Leptolyngbya] sp. PCC 7376]|uniref:prolyl hydroxylase family protein n=1 Tax=[Leptolyngbya] sp. PCC 7376 TaxID=111781 RepID=UPI00029F3882|nr:2OG-Fe(II) oxygenase [[Leptolyngbya] sp. PCC 7376]AFY37929.1 Prolyl 4-hydroxylase alpha subunit [[Leptolyngbya] sp. PCC 7376]